MPRMIDQRLGQEVLGVWDFAWSLVTYFGLVSAGIASSVNRYVAKYRVAGDLAGVNAVVSSACFIMAISGLLALGLTVTLFVLIPYLFGARLGDNVREAQWVVLFLGTSVAVEIALQPYNGVLTGCHRWGLRNLIESGWHATTIAGQITALLIGAGLRFLSMVYLIGIILAYLTRIVAAYRVCRGLRIRPSMVRWATVRDQFAFGGKTLIPSISRLLLNQTTSILIVAYLGPAMLALYTRPRSLILHVNTLVKKMAFVLIPTVSSMQSQENLKGVRELLTTSVRYSCYMVLPIALVQVVFGGAIMEFWMGPRYGNGWLPALLALGFLPTLVQTPVWPILVGLNAHGRAGVAELVASVCSALLIVLGLRIFNWQLSMVAVMVCVPLAVMNLTYLPRLICHRTGLSVKLYVLSTIVKPLIYIAPFAACLTVSRILWSGRPLIGLSVGAVAGAIMLVPIYWRCVLPDSLKNCVVHSIRRVLRLTGLPSGADAIS